MTQRKHPHNGTPLAVAAECLGVDLTDDERRAIILKARIGAAVDDIVDLSNDGTFQEIGLHSLTTYFDPEHFEWLKIWSDAPDYAEVLRAMYELHEGKRIATSIREYEAALMEEAAYFADVFSVDPLDAERRRLNIWIGNFARGGYCVDAAVDMPSDYADGQIQVVPSLKHRYTLLERATKELAGSLTILRRPRVVRAIAATSIHTLREG